jgi:hypothetical protein
MEGRTTTIVAAVNDETILAENLRLSPDLGSVRLVEMRAQPSAAIAYNRGADMAGADVLVFAHQDVYLPAGWVGRLHAHIARIEATHGAWGMLGVYGVRADGTHVGHCWSSGLQRELGGPFAEPVPIVSADELVLVVNGRSGLRFDEALPGFHLYGTDIAQTSLERGLGAFAVHDPVVHNSRRVRSLAGAYTRAYDYMRRKWRKRLPIPTTVVALTRTGLPLWRHRASTRLGWLLRAGAAAGTRQQPGHSNGRDIAVKLGYE